MRKIIVSIIMCSLLLCSCSKKTASSEEISLKDNQSMVIGKITEVTGNDMTISLLEEKSLNGRDGMGGKGNMPMPTGEDGRPEMPEGKGDMPMPTGEDGRPEMPEGKGDMPMPTGEDGRPEMPEGKGDMPMPTGEDGRPKMPEGKGDMPMPTGEDGRPEMPEGKGDMPMPTGEGERSDMTERKGDKEENRTVYVETGETASYSIPVGTTVTTALGTETTFSRLAEGDTVKIVLEKDDSGNDVVVGIWIVE